MKKSLTTAITVSIVFHASIFVGFAWWSLHNLDLLGGGSGVVEVAVVGGQAAVRPELVEGRAVRVSTSSTRTGENVSPSRYSEKGQGNGGAGGLGDGVGAGSGPGDPRLVTIWKRINRAKYYPETARRDGVEGAPKVVFSILEDGKVSQVKIVESSGNAVLDGAAMEAIQNSAPLPFYPQPITIAVRYSLKDR